MTCNSHPNSCWHHCLNVSPNSVLVSVPWSTQTSGDIILSHYLTKAARHFWPVAVIQRAVQAFRFHYFPQTIGCFFPIAVTQRDVGTFPSHSAFTKVTSPSCPTAVTLVLLLSPKELLVPFCSITPPEPLVTLVMLLSLLSYCCHPKNCWCLSVPFLY